MTQKSQTISEHTIDTNFPNYTNKVDIIILGDDKSVTCY